MLAWLVAVLNNFVLNRHWTFDAAAGSARLQAIRFFLVSLVAEGFSLGLLTILVESAGIEKVAAQALAVAAVMPLNFLGNKLWSFRARRERRAGRRDVGEPGGGGRGGPAKRCSRPQRVPILWIPPTAEERQCRRWSSTASASTWSASSRSCC